MTQQMRHAVLILLAPVLCAGLLAGMVAQKATYVKPRDVEPYHARAKAAIEGIRYNIRHWSGRDEPVVAAAQKLLRPNVILNRTYVEHNPARRQDRAAILLIVQCRDSRDMLGHYPPICYVSHGMTLVGQQPRDWKVGDVVIPGTEYVFEEIDKGQTHRRAVYNFLIVPGAPGNGIVRDMEGLGAAAEDYQQRYYGAAQFQVVMDGDLPQEDRDDIFATLIGDNTSLLTTLNSGASR